MQNLHLWKRILAKKNIHFASFKKIPLIYKGPLYLMMKTDKGF